MAPAAEAATYYVDFQGGSDAASGTSPRAALKHCPGDEAAEGTAAGTTLAPGDTVLFKGGVHYRGHLTMRWSGAKGKPITYDGNTAGTFGRGPAIIGGADNEEALTAVKKEFPEAKTSLASINWYRNKARSDGNSKVKTARELKKAKAEAAGKDPLD